MGINVPDILCEWLELFVAFLFLVRHIPTDALLLKHGLFSEKLEREREKNRQR